MPATFWIEHVPAFSQPRANARAHAGAARQASPPASPVRAALRLTPQGKLVFEDIGDAPGLDARAAVRLRDAFARGSGEGLWRLGAGEIGENLPPVFVWWRDFAARFVTALRHRPMEKDAPGIDASSAGIE
ncbi:MAG: hypothetical protein ACREDM_14550, partial [Methylocella sp.]